MMSCDQTKFFPFFNEGYYQSHILFIAGNLHYLIKGKPHYLKALFFWYLKEKMDDDEILEHPLFNNK